MTKSDTILKKGFSEKEFEGYLVENIHDIAENCRWGEIKKVDRQCSMRFNDGRIRCDVMLWHKDGTGTCIEVKTGNNNRNDDLTGLSQLLFYGISIEKKLSNAPRLVLVTPKIKNILWQVIKKYDLPICLLELTEDKCIYLSNGSQ